MEENEEDASENHCASCGSPIPPGALTCAKCSQVKTARKRRTSQSPAETSESVSILRTPEEKVRRGVAHGTLTKNQGELLLLLLSDGRLLDFSMKSLLTSLVKEIAEEKSAQRREEKVYLLVEFVSVTMPSTDLASRLSRAFKLR